MPPRSTDAYRPTLTWMCCAAVLGSPTVVERRKVPTPRGLEFRRQRAQHDPSLFAGFADAVRTCGGVHASADFAKHVLINPRAGAGPTGEPAEAARPTR